MTCSIQHLGPGKSGPRTLLIKWQPSVEKHRTTRKICEAKWGLRGVTESLLLFREALRQIHVSAELPDFCGQTELLLVPGLPQLGHSGMETVWESVLVKPTRFWPPSSQSWMLALCWALLVLSLDMARGQTVHDSWTWRRQQPPLLHSLTEVNKEPPCHGGSSLSYIFTEGQQKKTRWLRPGLWSQAAWVWTPNVLAM